MRLCYRWQNPNVCLPCMSCGLHPMLFLGSSPLSSIHVLPREFLERLVHVAYMLRYAEIGQFLSCSSPGQSNPPRSAPATNPWWSLGARNMSPRALRIASAHIFWSHGSMGLSPTGFTMVRPISDLRPADPRAWAWGVGVSCSCFTVSQPWIWGFRFTDH